MQGRTTSATWTMKIQYSSINMQLLEIFHYRNNKFFIYKRQTKTRQQFFAYAKHSSVRKIKVTFSRLQRIVDR